MCGLGVGQMYVDMPFYDWKACYIGVVSRGMCVETGSGGLYEAKRSVFVGVSL